MVYGEILMVGIILLTVIIIPVTVSAAWRLTAVVWLATFQIYLYPVHDFYPSLAFLCSIGLWPELVKHGRELLRWRVTQCYFLLMAVQVVSLAWSPDIGQGVRLIILMIPFVFILAATIEVIGRREDLVRRLVYGVLAGAAVEAALVIAFHLQPVWEKWFISSSIAPLFINPNALTPGHMDVKRWSAFLLNSNTAAGYLGICSLLAYAVAWRYRRWWPALIGAFLAVGIFFTGSKGGMLLLVLLYMTGCCMLAWPKLNRWTKYILLLVIAVFGVLLVLNLDIIAQAIGRSWAVREKIWSFGRLSFFAHPVRGLGFGGWEVAIAEYANQVGLKKAYAPHNTIIGLWSQSGLAAAILGILFIVGVLSFAWRSRTTPKWREFMVCATLALAWYFIHQQVDNWGLVNERHIMPIVAMLIGIIYVVARPLASRVP